MGGIAAIARAAGHRVTGSDRNVYPPMSTQLAALGIDVIEGYEPDQLELNPDVFVVGNVMSRGNALVEALLDSGRPLRIRPRMAGAQRAAGRRALGARRGRHARQDDDQQPARVDPRARGPRSRVPGRRRAARLRRQRAARRGPALRDRGRRVRHRVLRQARQVRPLPAAHRDPEQPRARPRRHLPGRGVDPEAVPPAAAHGAGQRPAGRQRRRSRTSRKCCRWAAGRRSSASRHDAVRRRRTGACSRPRRRQLRAASTSGAASAASAASSGTCSAVTTPRTRSRPWRPRATRASDEQAALEALRRFGGVKRRLEVRGIVRGIVVYDDFAHHPTAIATTLDGVRRKAGKGRVIAVLEPRSNTMKLGTHKAALATSLARRGPRVRLPVAGSEVGRHRCDAAARGSWRPCTPTCAQLAAALVAEARPGDHLVLMSNGSFGGLHERLLRRCATRRQAPAEAA